MLRRQPVTAVTTASSLLQVGQERQWQDSSSMQQHSQAQHSDRPQESESRAYNENAMNVVMVGAECAPWSKTGALPSLAPFKTTLQKPLQSGHVYTELRVQSPQ